MNEIEANKPSSFCWVCGSSDVVLWKTGLSAQSLRPEDFRITDAGYGKTLELFRCQECAFIFAGTASGPEIVSLYAAMHDEGYEQTSSSRLLQMQWLLRSASRLRPTARSLLDIGAGTGLMLMAAEQMGIVPTGIEPSEAEVQFGRSRMPGTRFLTGTLPHPELTGEIFDIVCLVDVIEHVCSPVKLLQDAKKMLAPGGLIVVVTPDINSFAARRFGTRWWHFRLAHVGYFAEPTFRMAAEKAGLAVERMQRAKWFFPIDYLATRLEQYLPIRRLNSLLRHTPLLRRIYRQVIPVNLFDSWVFFLNAKDPG